MARIIGGRSYGKTYKLLKDLEKQINKIDNPFDKRLYINSNKINIKELEDIDFKNIEYVITSNLPDDIIACIVNKKEFDNFL